MAVKYHTFMKHSVASDKQCPAVQVQSMMLTFLINLPGLCHRWECPIPPFPGQSLSCQGIGTDTTIHPSVRPLYMYIYNKETTLYNKSRSVILRKIILNGQQRILVKKIMNLKSFVIWLSCTMYAFYLSKNLFPDC